MVVIGLHPEELRSLNGSAGHSEAPFVVAKEVSRCRHEVVNVVPQHAARIIENLQTPSRRPGERHRPSEERFYCNHPEVLLFPRKLLGVEAVPRRHPEQ